MEDFHVGVRPFDRYRWLSITESANANLMVTSGDQIDGWLLRMAGPNRSSAFHSRFYSISGSLCQVGSGTIRVSPIMAMS